MRSLSAVRRPCSPHRDRRKKHSKAVLGLHARRRAEKRPSLAAHYAPGTNPRSPGYTFAPSHLARQTTTVPTVTSRNEDGPSREASLSADGTLMVTSLGRTWAFGATFSKHHLDQGRAAGDLPSSP